MDRYSPQEVVRLWWQHGDVWLELISTVGCFLLSVTVARKLIRGKLYRQFLWVTAPLAAWGITHFVRDSLKDEGAALFLTRVGRVLSLWIPWLFYRFHLNFTGRKQGFFQKVLVGMAPPMAVMTILCMTTPWYVASATLSPNSGRWVATVGPLYYLQVAMLLFLLSIALFLLTSHIRASASGVEKNRTKYLLLGSVALGIPALGDSFRYLGWFTGPTLFPLGMVAFCFIIFWGMYRRRLLDLDFALKQFATGLLLFAATFLLFSLIQWASQEFFQIFHLSHALGISQLTALLCATIFFNKYMPRLGEAAFSRLSPYRTRYTHGMKVLAGRLSVYQDKGELSKNLIRFFKSGLALNAASFYLAARPSGADRPLLRRTAYFGPEPPETLEVGIPPRMGAAPHTLVLSADDLKRRLRTEVLPAAEMGSLEQWTSTLDGLRAELSLPLFHGEEMLGLVSLGPKPVGIYDAKDMELLETLGRQLSSALTHLDAQALLHEKEKLAALGEMAAVVAHEVKNPLSAIQGAAQYLQDSLTNEGDKKFARIILQETQRLDGSVLSFLQFSKPLAPVLQAGDPDQVLAEALELFRLKPEFRRVEAHPRLEAGQRSVPMDKNLIKQVFLNLIDNACQAMEKGGTLTASSESIKETGGSYYRASISDTGPGIPETVRPHLFKPFFTTRPRGTGLGLSLCRSIVHAHGGKITLESSPGRTVFRVDLPLTPSVKPQ